VYLYPYKDPKTHELLTSENLKVSENLKELFKYFKLNRRIVDIKDFNLDMQKFIPEIFFIKLPITKKVGKAKCQKALQR